MRRKPQGKLKCGSAKFSDKASASRSVASVTASNPKLKQRKRRRRLTFQKYGWKVNRPRFDAFEIKQKTPDGHSKTVVVAPEIGIHSLEWARAIVPQSSPLLRLPPELREKVNILVLSSESNLIIEPGKSGGRFTNLHHGTKHLEAHRNLSLVSRQFYVDVTGFSLLYKVSTFVFGSEMLMANYLSSINPANKGAITDISVQFSVAPYMSRKDILLLASLPNLKHLTLSIWLEYSRCQAKLKNNTPLEIIRSMIEKVRDNKHLREIKNLKSLEVDFHSHYSRRFDPPESLYKEVEAELKQALVKRSKA